MKVGLSYNLKATKFPAENDPGDDQEEYDSPETVDIIKKSLECAGYEVELLGGGREFVDKILANTVNIVFNIAEGFGSFRSREAQVPAMLEMLGMPYSGSDPQCLSICLDKPLTKQLVSIAGIPTPGWKVFRNKAEFDIRFCNEFSYPAIIKPAWEGSSKGIHQTSLVTSGEEAGEEIKQNLEKFNRPVMMEEFIDGDEVTVGIIGNSPPVIVGIMRILPREKSEHFVYSLEVKRDWKRLVEYECPAFLNRNTSVLLRECSLKAYDVLGCRDFARVDFRVTSEGKPYFIEINPLPGLGTYSDLIIMAKKLGWIHNEVIMAVFNAALKRYPQFVCV